MFHTLKARTTKVFSSQDEIDIPAEDIIKVVELSFPAGWEPADANLLTSEQLAARRSRARDLDGKAQVHYWIERDIPETEEYARGEE